MVQNKKDCGIVCVGKGLFVGGGGSVHDWDEILDILLSLFVW